jgi:hypothetical protein
MDSLIYVVLAVIAILGGVLGFGTRFWLKHKLLFGVLFLTWGVAVLGGVGMAYKLT